MPQTIQTKVGVFSKLVSTIGQQQVSVGFRPNLVFFFMAGPIADDTWSPHVQSVFAVGRNHGGSPEAGKPAGGFRGEGISGAAYDAQGTSICGSLAGDNKVFNIINYNGGAVLAAADWWDYNDGFILDWTTNNAVAHRIGYIAIAGLHQVNSGDFSFNAIGNVVSSDGVTGPPNFTPDLVMAFNRGAATTKNSTVATMVHSIGMMTPADQWCVYGASVNTQSTSATYRASATDAVLLGAEGGGATPTTKVSYVSMDALGFTVNVSAVPSVRMFQWVTLKGGRHKLGSFTKSTSAAPATQSITGLGFQPKAVMLFSNQDVASASNTDHHRYGVGASDGTNEYAIAFTDTSLLPDTSIDACHAANKAFVKVDNNTNTIDAAADVTMTSDGFDVTWTTNDAVATKLFYWAIGDGVADTPTRLYPNNANASYSPATFKGAWDTTTGVVTKALSIDKFNGGSLTTNNPNKTPATADYDLAVVRGVSAPLQAQTISGEFRVVSGVLGSGDRRWHAHVYVTQGDSDLVRGTLLTDFIGTSVWGSSATFFPTQVLTPVAVSAGDRLVIELGARSTAATSGGANAVYYGGGLTTLDGYPEGFSSSWAPWYEFSQAIQFASQDARVSQIVMEAALEQTAAVDARISQLVMEAALQQLASVDARLSQIVLEVAVASYDPTPIVTATRRSQVIIVA